MHSFNKSRTKDYFSPQVTLKYILKFAQFVKLYHKSSDFQLKEVTLYKH